MDESIKIPKERIAALIGKNGRIKQKIEKLTNTKVNVESETGNVLIEAKEKGLDFYNALSIIKAIGRGFAPEKAFLLSDEENYLDIIDLAEIVGGSKKQLEVKKGRIIGRKGKARDSIEQSTNCFISVYGKTVSIIGNVENVENARRAIEMLLGGAKHSSVLGFLKRKEIESSKFEL
ncbi:MAG: RNA-processing protein [Candidatus Diapherotrites archaeon]|uniref:RNA-processing protein n=1 Tax=Candidatus Iainarchaeum sp. TaxID=3101447 RepID=A0A2D6M1D8_9ARCH|nr:RNA-processing protein [Candidatus Diapherotrites archaeon]|tara:strand:+ start:1003 stop:1533 length:531 start_codon:yes stop_codon:yes gene_type:complete